MPRYDDRSRSRSRGWFDRVRESDSDRDSRRLSRSSRRRSPSRESRIFDLELDSPSAAGPSRRSSSSAASWQPAWTTSTSTSGHRARSPPRSSFFASSPSDASSPRGRPSGSGRSATFGRSSEDSSRRSHASSRGSLSVAAVGPSAVVGSRNPSWSGGSHGITFGRSSGDDSSRRSHTSSTRSPTRSVAGPSESRSRMRPQVFSTSFHSGFSSDMEIVDGQERFRPGSNIHTEREAYKAAQQRADDAQREYKRKVREHPDRKEDYSAGIGGKRIGLDRNYSVEEHRSMRRTANDAFRNRREETLGREAFNDKYHRVWEKRKRQTGGNSDFGHEDAARGARNNANKWLDKSEKHAYYLDFFGEKDVTPLSSWGGRSQ